VGKKMMNQSYNGDASSAAWKDKPETSKAEVKGILMSKLKEFRDLIHIYQKKNKINESILPVNEFRTILKGIGINMKISVSLCLLTCLDSQTLRCQHRPRPFGLGFSHQLPEETQDLNCPQWSQDQERSHGGEQGHRAGPGHELRSGCEGVPGTLYLT
jgi:hypothetical protein